VIRLSNEPADWSEKMIRIIRQVTDDLPAEAEEFLREDPESLNHYLSSELFLEDLQQKKAILNLDAETFFLILYKQFLQRLEDDEVFRRKFQEHVDEHPGSEWTADNTEKFFDDPALIEYLVEMLDRFVQTENVYRWPGETDEDYHYIVDMLNVAVDAGDAETFQIFCHIGNYSLYLTGVIPDWVNHRHEVKKRPMDLDSYRSYGKAYFERAAQHELARKEELQPVLTKLHKGYDLVRTSLHLILKELTPSFPA